MWPEDAAQHSRVELLSQHFYWTKTEIKQEKLKQKQQQT